jgi:Rrf2 family protein
MTLSRQAAYAVLALVDMASQPAGRRSGPEEISLRQKIPISYLEKILQTLRRRGLLRAVRGAGGGYEFVVPPQRISLLEVVETFGQRFEPSRCALRLQGCCPAQPCLLHRYWADLQEEFVNRMRRTTVADLAADCGPARGAACKNILSTIGAKGR